MLGLSDSLTGALLAGLTLVYIVATISLIYTNRKTVKELQLARKHQIMPRVILQFDVLRKGACCLILRNDGNSVAKNVLVQFSIPSTNNLGKLNEQNNNILEKLSAEKITLAPGQRIVYCLCGMEQFEQLSAVPLQGNISYKNMLGEIKTEDFLIETSAYEHSLIYGSDAEEAAAIIKAGTDEIAKELKEVAKLIQSKSGM